MENLIHAWLPSLVAVGALGLVWAGFQSSKKTMENAVEKQEKFIIEVKKEMAQSLKTSTDGLKEFIIQIQKEMRSALYNSESGMTRFMPRADCDHQTGACQRAICSKLDSLDKFLRASDADILQQMVRMDDKREKTKENLRSNFELLKGAVDNLTGKFEQREVDRRDGK